VAWGERENNSEDTKADFPSGYSILCYTDEVVGTYYQYTAGFNSTLYLSNDKKKLLYGSTIYTKQ
jgi:hypothetical protein